ncbi:MAG: GNAT family N-acetyltransferase [Candidatus Micrarchaeota archaeon]
MEIRRTKDADLIASVINACPEWNEELWVDKDFFKNLKQGWVAYEEGKAVGCVILNESDGQCEYSGLAVIPEFRGKGISKKLSEAVFAYCRKNKIKKIYAVTRLYGLVGKLGFRETDFKELAEGFQACLVCPKRGKTCNPKAYAKEIK